MRVPFRASTNLVMALAATGFFLGCGSEAQPEDDPLADPAALEADLQEQERMIQQERSGG